MTAQYSNDPTRRDPDEWADLYAAGALTPEESRVFEARLASGDADFMLAFERVRPALDALLDAGTAPVPRHLREGIEAAVMAEGDHRSQSHQPPRSLPSRTLQGRGLSQGAQSDDAEELEAGNLLVILREAHGRWLPTGVPGVQFRPLSSSRSSNRRTVLLKMAPNTALPDHDHAGVEEVYVISGELQLGNERLAAGDYFRVEPGARHPTPVSPTGCVCMVISDYQPFPLTSWLGFVWAFVRGLFRRAPKA